MKSQILLNLPSDPMAKQSQIIITCLALHNFIRESAMVDEHFDMTDHDENYVPPLEASSSQGNIATTQHGDEDQNMNQFRDCLIDGSSYIL